MKKRINKFFKRLGIATLTYAALVLEIKSIEQINLSHSQPLEVPSAVQVLEEEKQKLGITNRVDLYTYEEFNFKREDAYGFSSKTLEGYLIASRSNALNRHLIRHELYHLHSGDLETELTAKIPSKELITGLAEYFQANNSPNNSTNASSKTEATLSKFINSGKFWLIEEPRASLYALLGIRL